MVKRLPPATIAALSPPPGAGFPYTFFENVASVEFAPQKQGFDRRNAWWLCDAAFLAYSDAATIQAKFAEPPLSARVQAFAGRRATSCYVADAAEWIVLAFRGTEVDNFWGSALDVITDVHLVPVPDEHRDLVHAGFLHAVDEVWRDVREHIVRLQRHKVRPLWITGHSLGAGLATIAAARCSTDPELSAFGLYVYASPPVGDRAFAARMRIPAFRVANNADWLTHVPYGVFGPVGTQMFIDANGHLHEDMSSALQQLVAMIEEFAASAPRITASRFLRELGPAIVLPAAIADHAPINYAIRLWNLFGG